MKSKTDGKSLNHFVLNYCTVDIGIGWVVWRNEEGSMCGNCKLLINLIKNGN